MGETLPAQPSKGLTAGRCVRIPIQGVDLTEPHFLRPISIDLSLRAGEAQRFHGTAAIKCEERRDKEGNCSLLYIRCFPNHGTQRTLGVFQIDSLHLTCPLDSVESFEIERIETGTDCAERDTV